MTKEEQKIREALSSLLVSIHFGEIERKILYVLADGEPHSREEIMGHVDEEQWTTTNLSSHVKNIRRKLKQVGHGIVCELREQKFHYRYVIFLHSVLL